MRIVPYETAEQHYDRLEHEWLESRAVGNCEDCSYWWQVIADENVIDSVMFTIGWACRKSPDVERTWDSVLTQIRSEIKCAIESHGHCEARDFFPLGDTPAEGCEDWMPLTGVIGR